MIPPWRDVALSLELGDRVLTELMTLEDWEQMILLCHRQLRPVP